jgi:sugar lactone lactonase YvrE
MLILVLGGCSGSDAATEHVPAVAPPHEPASAGAIALDGDASGAWWDAGGKALLVTDSTHATIERWTASTGFSQAATLPDPRAELGGLVVLRDGRTLVTSFGFGSDGAVFVIAADGKVSKVPNLARERRRIGIALGADDAVYVTYFVVQSGKHSGGVARIDLAGGETDIADDLPKPVGIVASDKVLYVADQERGEVIGYPLADLAHPQIVAHDLPSADLLTLLPNGDLVTGGKRGAVYRITPAGAVTTIASGFEHVRGTAYDADAHRLYVVDHSVVSSRHKLHVVELR